MCYFAYSSRHKIGWDSVGWVGLSPKAISGYVPAFVGQSSFFITVCTVFSHRLTFSFINLKCPFTPVTGDWWQCILSKRHGISTERLSRLVRRSLVFLGDEPGCLVAMKATDQTWLKLFTHYTQSSDEIKTYLSRLYKIGSLFLN